MICPGCAQEVGGGNKFCPQCGAFLVGPSVANPPVAVAPPAPQVVYAPAPIMMRTAVRHDGLAVAGMVIGIVSLVIFWWAPVALVLSIVGIVLSAVAMKRIKSSMVEVAGYGMAVAGLATSICAAVLSAIMLMIFLG